MNTKLLILLFFIVSVTQNIFGKLKDINTDVHPNLSGTIKGFVKDENNNPVKHAVVLLYKDDNLEDNKAADVNGSFTFANVDPGHYKIKVNQTGYIDYEVSSFEVTANSTSHLDLKLQTKAYEVQGGMVRTGATHSSFSTSCRFSYRSRCCKPPVKIYIVDDSGKSIVNPVVWRFKQPNDSVKRGKSIINDSIMDYYEIPLNGSYNNYPDKWLLIQAKGYADVIIRNVEGSNQRYYKSPDIYIKMYPRQYVRKGDLYALINTFVYDNVILNDSLILDFKYYTERILNLTSGSDNRFFIVKTYPNPVRDKLSIDINLAIEKPYKALLFDVQGQMISETRLTDQHSVLDMEWQVAGIYFIQVFDPEGVLLYAFKFIKV